MSALPARFGDRFVYSSHNDEFVMKNRALAGHPEQTDLLKSVKKAEDFCLRTARLTVAVSDQDADAFARRLDSGGPIAVVPNGADAPTEPSSDDEARAAGVGEHSVAFVGSGHTPNVEALFLLRDVVAPALPDVEFHIIGSVGRAAGSVPPNVYIWDEVGPGLKTAILRRVAIGLNPVYSGGGSNVKMSDYFAHGLPTVTSEFGLRGYPASVRPFVEMADARSFATAITTLLERFPPGQADRQAISDVFARQLSMAGHAARYSELVRDVGKPRRRLLAVTYRYTDPALGGAEVMLRELLRKLDATGSWAIDVVSPDVGTITDHARFSCEFGRAEAFGTPHGLTATRWHRFALRNGTAGTVEEGMLQAWRVQAAFEEALARYASNIASAGVAPRLLAGWHNADSGARGIARWTTEKATFETGPGGRLLLRGWSPRPMEFSLTCAGATFGASVAGTFKFTAEVPPGEATLRIEARQIGTTDMRLLGLRLTHVSIDGRSLLGGPTLVEDLPTFPFVERIEALNRAARATRWPAGVELTRLRGPHSPDLRRWLQQNIADYDVLLTHNCVFLPAIEALELAKARGVPSVFIPHIHLDDDFYHFPDVARAIERATISLVSPRAAVDFLRKEVSPHVRYFGAGAEPAEFAEELADRDLIAFREKLIDDGTPLILVLGRKAVAKNYSIAVDARRLLAARGTAARLVMIGPDDDGAPVDEPGVVYLGIQPREVVRGALRSATVLVNMSASESFGIVLLEAWLAGTPVIVNRNCAAFADLVENGVNGFLVDGAAQVAECITAILANPQLSTLLAERGRDLAVQYSWSKLAEELDAMCTEITRGVVPHPA